VPQSLIKTPRNTAQALEVNGRSLVASHDQISNILKSRLGQNHGELLAQPRIGVDGDIAWSSGLQGPVTPATELPEEDRAKLLQRAERLRAEIRGLAEQMRAEGPAAQVVAQILERALQVPPGDWLYSVGGKPVYVMWGHAATGTAPAPLPQATPQVPAAAPVAAATGATFASGEAPPLPPPPLPPAPPPPGRGGSWKRWVGLGLLGLLLLALLFFGLKRCGASQDEDLRARIAEAEARNRALEEELARKRAAQMMCVADPPAPAASAPEPPAPAPEPPASAPEPAASVPEPALVPPAPVPSAPAARKPPAPPERPASRPAPPKPAVVPPSAPAPVPRSEAPLPPPQRQACKPRQPGDEPEVVLIVDASGSMRSPFGAGMSRLDAAKRAADAMIRGLPADVDVGLVDFTACNQVRRDKFYSAAQRGALIGEINGLSPKQGTPLAQAIERAGRVASDSADSVLVIVSDGADSCGGDPCATARALRAQKPNLKINVIDLADTPRERQVLQCIASAGGGRVLRPGDPLDMNRKMKEAVGSASCPP
ncbi:MAG TPA: VWA domain-containing protein, partial [Rubrivivax sp.]|nr:VWA domain-containing protein [Rubrivivax sp.]